MTTVDSNYSVTITEHETDNQHWGMIRTGITDAMKQTCCETFLFAEDPNQPFKTEYHLTVNIAKKISEQNQRIGNIYKLILEHSIIDFATEGPAPIMFAIPDDILSSATHRGNYDDFTRKCPPKEEGKRNEGESKERIDLAIYCDERFGKCPVCAIEVKGFNPQKTRIIEDLNRNLSLLSIEAPTGLTRLNLTVFAALHSYQCPTPEKKREQLSRLKRRYGEYLTEISSALDGVVCHIDAFTVSSRCLNDFSSIEQEDGEATQANTHHWIGVIVSFSSP